MDLDFSDDQEELRGAVRKVLADKCSLDEVRAVVEGSASYEPLWEVICSLDWQALLIPESFGGLGLGDIEMLVVLEELGRSVAPGPFVPTAVHYVRAILELGTEDQKRTCLEPVAAGGRRGAVALGTGSDELVSAARLVDGWSLSGTKHFVIGGDVADDIVITAQSGEGETMAFVVAREALNVRTIRTADATRTFADLTMSDLVVGDDCRLSGSDAIDAALGRLREHMAVTESVLGVGVCQAIFDMTLQYAKDRHQFGVPIGSFQAIKHKLVDMYISLERARALTYYGALTLAENAPDRALAASVAKVAFGDCERLLFQQSIQTHGAIGYTWEHPLHILLKRAHSCDELAGSRDEHQRIVAELLRRGVHQNAAL